MPPLVYRPGYFLAIALCGLTAAVALPLRHWLDQANIVMIFLLVVFLIAVRLGRGPAVLATLLSVALFDVFFVPPHFSLSVADAQYLVTFVVMLAVGLTSAHLTAQLAERRELAQAREAETRGLYELAQALGATLTFAQAAEVLERTFSPKAVRTCLLIAESLTPTDPLSPYGSGRLDADGLAQATNAYREGRMVSRSDLVCLPFSGVTRMRGVLVLCPGAQPLTEDHMQAIASLVGTTVERIHFTEVARQSELDAQTEKLRATLLSSMSHDLRTPLTTLIGLADSLADSGKGGETAVVIRDQAHAMHRMVSNLLDMARLQSGRVTLNKRWQPFEDIVGSSVRLLGDFLDSRQLVIDLPGDLPLVEFDAVLMERVLCNLLENAAKYSAPGTAIRLAGGVGAGQFVVSVANEGSRFPDDRLSEVFDAFERGTQESATPGTGIGLAVCKAIVGIHGGQIVAENTAHGACVRFTLPLGNPPVIEGEPA